MLNGASRFFVGKIVYVFDRQIPKVCEISMISVNKPLALESYY